MWKERGKIVLEVEIFVISYLICLVITIFADAVLEALLKEKITGKETAGIIIKRSLLLIPLCGSLSMLCTWIAAIIIR